MFEAVPDWAWWLFWIVIMGLAVGIPVARAVDTWLWNYEPKGDDDGRRIDKG